MLKRLRFALVGTVLVAAAWARAAMSVTDLRCDSMVAPIGVDSPTPQLSWKLQATHRGARQTAWQVRAASDPDRLQHGTADLWDSGKVDDDRQHHVPYGGRALRSGEQVFWQVRTWDEKGVQSDWSAPATWTMGLLRAEDWAAKWITDPDLERRRREKLGFSTPPRAEGAGPEWLLLDLGSVRPIDSVRLQALTHHVPERLGFPRWFKIEISDTPNFESPRTLVDLTTDGVRNTWATRHTFEGKGARGRYLKLTATRLRSMMEDEARPEVQTGRLALSQIEVISAGKNIAPQATVSASSSLENEQFALAAVNDGLGSPETNERANETLLLRREFEVRPGLRRAVLFVAGLGHHVLAVNGARIGQDLLAPGWTDYGRTVLYDAHDLTAQLREGENAIGVMLAGGMYNVAAPGDRYAKFTGPYRPLKLIAQLRLQYADGTETVVTDASWKVARGPTSYSHVYGGEDHDSRNLPRGWDRPGFDAARWTAAAEVSGPGGALRGASHAGPPLRAQEVLTVKSIQEIRPGVSVYDFGQNASIIPRLRVRGANGANVKMIPAELVKPDGTVDRSSVGNRESSWSYTLSGGREAEVWQPEFFYHGARYLQVIKTPGIGGTLPIVEELQAVVVHAAVAPIGEFECSSPLFNQIRQLVRWAQMSNLQHVITDCPHRERLGWLEQYHLNGPSLRHEWDLERLFRKCFQDMADAQQPSGLVPSITPEYVRFDGGFRDSPEWGSALILAAWQHYLWTGDEGVLREHYDAMQRYAGYLRSRAKDHILSHGLGDWYDLGPNRAGNAQLTPVPLTATAFNFLVHETLGRIAAHLGRTDDAAKLQEQAREIGAAFNREFLDAKRKVYATGSQTSHAMPLVLGLVPQEHREAVVQHLVRDVQAKGLTAGDVGYRYLLRALAENGHSDVVFAMNHQSERPGYGFQIAHGATSLTEAWDANRHSSQNHFMLGHIMEWFYHDVAGLALQPDAPGYQHVTITPRPAGNLTWARATQETPYGKLAVRWEVSGAEMRVDVTVPPNAQATLHLPAAGDERPRDENGLPASEMEGVTFVGVSNGSATVTIGSGVYVFIARTKQ